jgi:crotonobetainyl-CoA:carnitine CoA-transferase CaiB-like acyl-CoA transferase
MSEGSSAQVTAGVPAAASRVTRVVNFSRNVPGPLAGRMLADLGYEVVKVENPATGDGLRSFFPAIHRQGALHWALNAGSKSIAVDPRESRWPAVVAALTKWTDVVIAGGGEKRTGRLGLSFSDLVQHNPRLVYVSITGYGEAGPLQDVPAHGLNPDAFAGTVPIEWADGQPSPPDHYASAGPTLSGVLAALGAVAALRRRDETAEAQYVHVSLFGAAFWFNWRNVVAEANLAQPWWTYQNIGSRYRTYATRDHRAILIAALERRFWEALCDLLRLPAEYRSRGTWGAGGGYDRGPTYHDERVLIAAAFAEKNLDHWCAELTRVDVPFAPILTAAEALSSDQVAANSLLRVGEMGADTADIPSSPLSITSSPDAVERRLPGLHVPELGEDTDSVLQALGLA